VAPRQFEELIESERECILLAFEFAFRALNSWAEAGVAVRPVPSYFVYMDPHPLHVIVEELARCGKSATPVGVLWTR